jgi:hypothetical protein
MAFENSCKNLNAIQQSDQKFSPFWDVILILPDQTYSTPICDPIANQ